MAYTNVKNGVVLTKGNELLLPITSFENIKNAKFAFTISSTDDISNIIKLLPVYAVAIAINNTDGSITIPTQVTNNDKTIAVTNYTSTTAQDGPIGQHKFVLVSKTSETQAYVKAVDNDSIAKIQCIKKDADGKTTNVGTFIADQELDTVQLIAGANINISMAEAGIEISAANYEFTVEDGRLVVKKDGTEITNPDQPLTLSDPDALKFAENANVQPGQALTINADGEVVAIPVDSSVTENSTNLITSGAVYDYVSQIVSSVINFKDNDEISPSTGLPKDANNGDAFVIKEAGEYNGEQCEVGDVAICIKSGTDGSDAEYVILQNNLDQAQPDKLGTIKVTKDNNTVNGSTLYIHTTSDGVAYVKVPTASSTVSGTIKVDRDTTIEGGDPTATGESSTVQKSVKIDSNGYAYVEVPQMSEVTDQDDDDTVGLISAKDVKTLHVLSQSTYEFVEWNSLSDEDKQKLFGDADLK